MAGTRDRIVHEYFGINYDIVRTVAVDELPAFLDQIDAIRATERFPIGSAADTVTHVCWGMDHAVWNNRRHGADTVYLYDSAGVLVDSYNY